MLIICDYAVETLEFEQEFKNDKMQKKEHANCQSSTFQNPQLELASYIQHVSFQSQ